MSGLFPKPALLSLAAAVLFSASSALAQPAGVPQVMSVQGAAVEARDLTVSVSAIGTLEASESAEIRVEIAGPVKSINFTEGGAVKKGSSLVQIDDSLIRAELMKAEAAHTVRKQTFERSDKLKASGYLSRQAWEQSGGSLQEAEADIATARIRLEKSRVPAPFDGMAGLRNFSVGDYLQVGEVLTTIDVIDPVKVTFAVPEKHYGEIKPGQTISFSVDAWPNETFEGKIYVISPRIDRQTRTFEVKAEIPNHNLRLRPGMFARINIETATHKDALVVPEQALIPRGKEMFVFVVRDDKAVLQKVETGLRLPGVVEITGGLNAGETVVTAGVLKLQNGMPVVVIK